MSEQALSSSSGNCSRSQRAVLMSRARTGEYRAHGSRAVPSCVVVAAFGHRRVEGNIIPGPSNDALARVVHHRFSEAYPGIPVIAEYEVADALRKGFGEEVAHRVGEPHKFVGTYALCGQAARYISEQGLLTQGSVALVAHPYHMPRADATLQACLPEGEETVVPAGIVNVPWDPESSHLQTRGPARWILREQVVMRVAASRDWLDATHAAA